MIVFDDADRQRSRRGDRRLQHNAGQDCTAPPGRWPSTGVAKDLADALAEQAKGAFTTFGRAADDEDGWIPPVNNPNQLERILLPGRHPQARRSGGRRKTPATRVARADGHQRTAPGRPAHPGGNLSASVITVQSSDEDEAIRFANGVEYGLARRCGPRTSNAHFGFGKLDFGCVWINTHIPLVAEMPHAATSPPDDARTRRCTYALRTTPASSM